MSDKGKIKQGVIKMNNESSKTEIVSVLDFKVIAAAESPAGMKELSASISADIKKLLVSIQETQKRKIFCSVFLEVNRND